MKANEFVKKHGLSVASELVNESEWSIKQLALATTTSMLDLKRLVESHDLVESYGGINGARKELANLCDSLIDCAYLCQAIADVEACKGVL